MVKLYKYYLLFAILNYVSAHRMLEEKTISTTAGTTSFDICINTDDEPIYYTHEYKRSIRKKEKEIKDGYDMYSYQKTYENGKLRYPFYCKNNTQQSYELWTLDAEVVDSTDRIKGVVDFFHLKFCSPTSYYLKGYCFELTNSSYTSWINDAPTEMCKHLYEDNIWALCFSKLEIIISGKTTEETISQMIVEETAFNKFDVQCFLNISNTYLIFKLMKVKSHLRLYNLTYENSTFTNFIITGERRSYFCDSYEFVNSTQNVIVRFKEMRFQARSSNQIGPYFRFGPIGFGCREEHQCKHCMGLRLPYWIIRLFWHYKLLLKRYRLVKMAINTNYTDLYE